MGDSRDGVKARADGGHGMQGGRQGRGAPRRKERGWGGGGDERRGPRLGSWRETKRGGIKDGGVDQR